MEYAQLNTALTEAIQVTTSGNVQWDANNFCTAAALIKDGKAAQFRVVPLIVTEPPAFNPDTQDCIRDGCEKVGEEWRYKWTVTPKTAQQIAANLAAARAEFIRKIDGDADAIYAAVQGNRTTEYLDAEQQALAYKAASYTGTVPPSVQSWATPNGKTAQWATDDILATAAAWRPAKEAIRANRLALKIQAQTATDLAPLMAQWAAFLVTIRAALGVA